MSNTITIAGFLSKDAEVRMTPAGAKITSLSIPTTSGSDKKTTWWRASFWGDKFEKMAPYFKKGACLIVTGSLTRPPNTYQKDGQTMVSALEISADMIQFAPGKKDEVQGQNKPSTAKYENENEELPF